MDSGERSPSEWEQSFLSAAMRAEKIEITIWNRSNGDPPDQWTTQAFLRKKTVKRLFRVKGAWLAPCNTGRPTKGKIEPLNYR